MTRSARTALLAVAALVGTLVGISPAQAIPDGAVALFEPSTTDSAQNLHPLGRTAAGTVWTDWYSPGVSVQPTGGDATVDDSFTFPDVVGDLITEVSYDDDDNATALTWRTIADPQIHVHEFPVDIDYEARTATGYVGVRGSGPYQVVRVDLVDDGAVTVVGTSTTNLGYLTPSSVGVAAMAANGTYKYFAFASASLSYTGKVVPTPDRYLECPWLSRAHLFCYSDTGLYRISVSTGAVSSASAMPMSMIETSTGVAFIDEGSSTGPDQLFALKDWPSTAPAPTTRVDAKYGLNGSLAPAGTAGAVLVGRSGPLGRAGIWSIPLPSGSAVQTLVAPPEPRRAGWLAAVSPGAVAWTDNTDPSGSLWTRDLTADGTPTGENRHVTDEADSGTLSAAAGRITYTGYAADGSGFYTAGTRLVDGNRNTAVDEDEDGWTAVLSGDRLLTESQSFFDDGPTWRLRDLRTGAVTTLAYAMDYDLWGERLVRLDDDGRVRLYDLRTGDAPVELRAPGPGEWLFGSVHLAGDMVAWDIMDFTDFTGLTGERATRDVATMEPATRLDDTFAIMDLSTGYVVGDDCSGDDCVTQAVALDDGQTTGLGVWYAAVDGDVVAGVDSEGVPSVQTLPDYPDAPRLLDDLDASALAGPGRTWKARIVSSRVLTACAVEIHDADSAVVRTLDCLDPYAAATVTWDGTDELGDPVPAGEYTWHVTGGAGDEDLVDYDGGDSALAGALTVNAEPAPTATTSPADDALRVAQNANVTASFSEPAEGVSGTTFRLTTPGGAVVPATVSYDALADKGTLNPTANLLADTTYTATLTGGPSAIRGTENGPLETTSWSFTTGPAPSLTSLTPASNATAASPSGSLTAVFSEAVTGLSTDTFELATEGGDPVAGAVTYNAAAKSATFNPTANLLPDTRYTATLTGGTEAVRDLAGNPLTSRSWSFTTGPAPTVTGKLPAASATGVSRTGNIVAAFSEPVTGVSGTTVKLKTSSGTSVSAAVSYSATSRKVTINPTNTLAASTKYTVTLTGGTTSIRDAAGNPLATTSWSFTTGS